MKTKITPFTFSDYRDFIREALKENEFSYRSFAKKYGEIISFIGLAQALSRGRSGTKNRPLRNFSGETLARLGKALKLKEDEISFLILLKLENDSEVYPGLFGAAFKDSVRSMIREQKARQNPSSGKAHGGHRRFSATAGTISELFDLLPSTARLRLSKEILIEAKGIRARQRGQVGVKAMSSVIQRLEDLSKVGSP